MDTGSLLRPLYLPWMEISQSLELYLGLVLRKGKPFMVKNPTSTKSDIYLFLKIWYKIASGIPRTAPSPVSTRNWVRRLVSQEGGRLPWCVFCICSSLTCTCDGQSTAKKVEEKALVEVGGSGWKMDESWFKSYKQHNAFRKGGGDGVPKDGANPWGSFPCATYQFCDFHPWTRQLLFKQKFFFLPRQSVLQVCSLTQATMWPKGVPHKATQLQTPLPAIWRWQFIEKSKTIIRFTKHKRVSTPIPRLPALPRVMRASVYFCQTGRRFLVNHPHFRYTQ